MPKITKAKSQETKNEASESHVPNDLYSEDLSSVKTTLPLLREDAYPCEVARFEASNSDDGTYTFHTLVLKTLEKSRDTDGKEQNPGYPLRFRVIQNNTKPNLDEVRRGLAKITQACKVRTANDLRPGLKLIAKTRNSREREKDGRTFEAQTEVRALAPLK